MQHSPKQQPKDRPFNPWRTSATPEARSLVDHVKEIFLQHESQIAPRKRARRPFDQETLDLQMDAIVSDLAYEYLVFHERWLSTSLSKTKLGNQGRYGPRILNKTYPEVIKLLSDDILGLVERANGSRIDWDGNGVKQTTIQAGPTLIDEIEKRNLGVSHFRAVHKGEVIILKRERENVFDENEAIQYVDTEQTIKYRSDVLRINDWLEKADIEYDEGLSSHYVDSRDRLLKRVFNNSSFEQGGRLYGGFWMRLSKKQRREGISINGNPVTTLDFGQIAPRIMYGMANAKPTFSDAYKLPSLDDKYREGIKKLFNALLHSEKRPSRFPQGVRQLIPDTSITVSNLTDAILESHSPIAHLFFSDYGLKVMYQESEILLSVLNKLMSEGIVALPIHDALIVEDLNASKVREVIISTFKEHTGVDINVDTDDV